MYRDYYPGARRYDFDEPDKPDGQVVLLKNDELGKERFAAWVEKFSHLKLVREHQARLDKILSVVTYRTQIAEQALFPRVYRDAPARLKGFKTVQYFLDAFETLYDDVVKSELERNVEKNRLAEEKKKLRESHSWRW